MIFLWNRTTGSPSPTTAPASSAGSASRTKDTIQGKLEAVLGTLQGHPVNVIGAGRTDAGVHARAMTANVVLDVTETPDALRDYLNRLPPDAIAVREVKEAAPRFHAPL